MKANELLLTGNFLHGKMSVLEYLKVPYLVLFIHYIQSSANNLNKYLERLVGYSMRNELYSR